MKKQRQRHFRDWFIKSTLSLILALSMLLPNGIIDTTQPVAAHNLQTKLVYMFFDPDTQAMLEGRASAQLQTNDEIGIIIKVIPRDGTTTGVGGHIDFYIPNGTQVLDVAYILPGDNGTDGITGYDPVPLKGQSEIAIGAGPSGAKTTAALAGLSGTFTNILGVTEAPVTTSGLHRGTIAGVYGDTGIFFSTDPATAYGSWQRFTGDADEICGLSGTPGLTGKTITNNSGDIFVPCNLWDAGQMFAWGVRGTTCTADGCQATPIVDPDGRGNTPWGFGSGVAGPQSGYQWAFDWEEWAISARDAAAMQAAMDPTGSVGPWQRIQYDGSRIAYDQPGSASFVLGTASVDGSAAGRNLGTTPFPATTSQTDATSPKAIRWEVGQLTSGIPEYAWVKIKITDFTALLDGGSCPLFQGDTFGGDAGGSDNGKDHLWRYYEPSRVTLNGCTALGKPTDLLAVSVGQVFQYKVKFYNTGSQALTNVVVRDTLPSGVTFLSSVPAQSSGPNPLVWNIGSLPAGGKFEAVVNVKATATGLLTNVICVTSDELGEQCYQEVTPSGSYPVLKQSKSADPTAVAPGANVAYTIRLDNIGSGVSASPTKIAEHLDANLRYVGLTSVTLNGANVTGATTVNATDPLNPIFTVPGGINAGQALLLTFTAKVEPNTQPGTYWNIFTTYAGTLPYPTGSLAPLIVAGGKIGDTIYRDWNGDGTQDEGEEGIEGVTVSLERWNGSAWVAAGTTTTDADGKYYFNGLTAGDYRVTVTPPADHDLTGDPDGCSGDPWTCATPNVREYTLATDEQYLTADFGYRPTGSLSIGDTIFEDLGNDGAFTAGEDIEIPGVTVFLYEDTNGDGIITPDVDALIATTTTDATGAYSFANLPAGNYQVYVDPGDTELGSYFTTKYGAGAIFQASTANAHPVALTTTSYDAADIGFWRAIPGSIGDQVFIDANGNGLFDTGESVLAGVTVWLYRDDDGDGEADAGELLRTTVTDAAGAYGFADLGPGDYLVVVDAASAGIPAGYGAPYTQYAVALVAGQTYTAADFPFVTLLEKTVDQTAVAPGATLNFGLAPYYPGSVLLSNVRIIDPLPAGTTYVASSANAGGSYGAYSPIAAVPGTDLAGGPSGTTRLDTSLTVSANFANSGGSVNVTLNVKQDSGVTVNSVAPTDFAFSGGDAVCSGPTPASADVPTGATGSNFVWSCTLSGAGEVIFSAAAANDTATYVWPSAASASVLSAPDGGPNVVTWNLGSNTARMAGETLTSGYTAGIYAFRGANAKEFSKYGVGTTDAWAAKAPTTNGIEKGGAMTTDGAGTIYALEGNSKVFYAYAIATNSWTTLAPTSDNANEGGAVQYLEVSGVKYVYALLGGSNRFRRYNVTGNTWTALANTPASVKKGGALTTDGTYLYALQGDRKTGFWRYNITDPDGTGPLTADSWMLLAPAPGNIGWGGSLARIGNFIYAMQGDGKTGFWRYDITTNTWTALAATPGNVGDGGALTTDGIYLYALQGKTTAFWRYDPTTNLWSSLASTNFTGSVGQGGALVYHPGLNPVGLFTAMSASPMLVSTGDVIKVRFQLDSSTAVANVSPSGWTVTAAGGAASCSSLTGPTLVSADDDIADINDGVVYEWACTVAAGTTPDSLTFSASGTGDAGSTTFPVATSNSVLVSPNLTYQVTVENPAPTSGLIQNTAILAEQGGAVGAQPSNTTETATTGSIGDYVWADTDGDGTQDTEELGLAGVKVYVDSNANGVWDAGEPYDISDTNGAYRIYGLSAGDYVVRTDPDTYPVGYTPTTPPVLAVNGLTAGQQYSDADFGLVPAGAGSIGDRIWLDKSNDGVQDEGEAGLPDIGVTLEKWVGGAWVPVATTTTDATGAYTFTGLPDATYRVTVDTDSTVTSPYDASVQPTLGDAMQPTYDLDGISTPHQAEVMLNATQRVYDTLDFGYRWGGSIGDFVWYDNNGNQMQDDGANSGAPYATLVLYYDVNGDGLRQADEPPLGVSKTAPGGNGAYLFENLPPGDYLIVISEQEIPSPTNPDRNSVMVTTTGDTQAITLAANEDKTDADFGLAEMARIEGHVYHDVNHNGVLDEGDIILPNVTVTLTGKDSNGNAINLTTTTDANGQYVFPVPAGEYTITYDADDTDIPAEIRGTDGEPTTPTSIFITPVNGVEYKNNDFGMDNPGSIGDRVWNDADNGGDQDTGELGIPGVTVNLYASDGVTLLATTVTDANGEYLFEGLPDGNYVVKVDTTTVPSGYTNTYDEDNGTSSPNNQTATTVSGGFAHLTADFGYYNNTSYPVSGNIFNDVNNSCGVKDVGDTNLAGITVNLYDNTGATIIATTQTDGSGNYTFPGIPNGSYLVKVDTSTLPSAAFVQTYESDSSTNNAIAVNISGSGSSGNDFGFNERLGSISGGVCNSAANGDGVCGVGETGVAGVTVTLHWAGPDGILGTSDDATYTTTTDSSGAYAFTGLQPGLYQIVKTNPVDRIGLNDADAGNPDNISLVLESGQNKTGQDFELQTEPTAITLTSFTAVPQGDAIRVAWETASELDNLGFNLYRGASPAGPWEPLNADLIPAQHPGAVFGGAYEWLDEAVEPETTYYYRLEDVDIHGASTFHGPVSATVSSPAAVAVVDLSANGNPHAGWSLFLALVPLALGAWKKRQTSF